MTNSRTYCRRRSAAGASSTTAQKQQQRATKSKIIQIKQINKNKKKIKNKTTNKQQTIKVKTNKTLRRIHDTLAHLLYTQKRSRSATAVRAIIKADCCESENENENKNKNKNRNIQQLKMQQQTSQLSCHAHDTSEHQPNHTNQIP